MDGDRLLSEANIARLRLILEVVERRATFCYIEPLGDILAALNDLSLGRIPRPSTEPIIAHKGSFMIPALPEFNSGEVPAQYWTPYPGVQTDLCDWFFNGGGMVCPPSKTATIRYDDLLIESWISPVLKTLGGERHICMSLAQMNYIIREHMSLVTIREPESLTDMVYGSLFCVKDRNGIPRMIHARVVLPSEGLTLYASKTDDYQHPLPCSIRFFTVQT